MKEFKKIAIANRGEVALRIVLACQEMGLVSVLLHSEADMESEAYRQADEKVCIGPAPASESYLCAPKVVDGAVAAGADALHPGFGFLSENANFAQLCADHNIVFIGPTPKTIEAMGDKMSAREIMEKAQVPVVPGYHGEDQSLATLKAEAQRIGFPLMIKAAHGGGGRGIKIAKTIDEFEEMLSSAKREAQGAFASDQVFLEKYLENSKHIEFQIFGDMTGRIYHLFDRECSVQRRHQKIIEEATSCSLSEEQRTQMAQAAVNAAKAVNYVGAGTVEFLLNNNKFYFLEMNTRLQVEHPVTEMVMGVDLVKMQIEVAQGKPCGWKQEKLLPRGHSIECRLYAENPYLGVPSTGVLGGCYWPQGPGRRFDFGFKQGDEITSFYDPMIAKLIVWDAHRRGAIEKMLKVLDETVVFGVQTNIPYLKKILNHPEFLSGEMTTQFIDKNFSQPIDQPEITKLEKEYAEQAYAILSKPAQSGKSKHPSPWNEPWRNV